MGIAESPLRGRVLFVEGAPRSGTTWLTALLATHPDIAGTTSETHLFDRGVGTLFENHESGGWGTWLSAYVSGDELTDLVRGLCDGVLLRMRERAKPGAAFVVEKTPLFSTAAAQAMERKLRCYPDAWFLHLVRDERATARSMVRAPFTGSRGERAILRGIRDAVDAIRGAAADHPRYLEVDYEELRADPGQGVAAILRWLGLEAGEEVLERVELLSGEHFSRFGAPPPPPRVPRSLGQLLSRARRLTRAVGRAMPGAPASPGGALRVANPLIVAVREGDADAVRELTTAAFSMEVRTGRGDVVAEGDEARRELLGFGGRVLGQPFVTVEWAPADGTPYATFLFHAIDGDANRVDVSLHAFPENDRVRRLTIVSAGSLDGRPLATWSAGSRRGTGH